MPSFWICLSVSILDKPFLLSCLISVCLLIKQAPTLLCSNVFLLNRLIWLSVSIYTLRVSLFFFFFPCLLFRQPPPSLRQPPFKFSPPPFRSVEMLSFTCSSQCPFFFLPFLFLPSRLVPPPPNPPFCPQLPLLVLCWRWSPTLILPLALPSQPLALPSQSLASPSPSPASP